MSNYQALHVYLAIGLVAGLLGWRFAESRRQKARAALIGGAFMAAAFYLLLRRMGVL